MAIKLNESNSKLAFYYEENEDYQPHQLHEAATWAFGSW